MKNYTYFLFILILPFAHIRAHKNIIFCQTKFSILQDTVPVFTLPEIPPIMATPEMRYEYLAEHYWDNMDFADNRYIYHPEIMEKIWVNYCDILGHVSLTTAQKSIKKTIEQTNVSKQIFTCITNLADKYLYNPNSPVRNEEFYIPVLEVMINSPLLNRTEKIRPQARLTLAYKNRIGTQASDFIYTLESGKRGSLYQLDADYILLFINNPGCHACSSTIEQLKKATIINELLQEKKLVLLSIYPDEELNEWKRHLSDFPNNWINAYDKQLIIRDKQLYDLKAIPTLYLIDKNKIVLLKDTSVAMIEKFLYLHK